MAAKIQLDEMAYSVMLDSINVFYTCNKPGCAIDIDFIKDDYWLQNTAVIENVEKRKGCWEISLVFAHHLYPFKFIKRNITKFSCFKKATFTAQYMRRVAAKDQRGTLTVHQENANITFN